VATLGENALADIWMRSSDRRAVTDAADRIDRILRLKPDKVGRAYKEWGVYAEPPLVVAYEVLPDDCLVRVLRVARP